ncbi:kinetochore complex Sim4 subunit Fta1-domain-containing protein [Sphaerosporella brunnea]|uniref:Kinetochore complex Sim4 subunit Fta1-domain-containing protein n=1 Tax=Sphaerosporella brunnea TaxID=1250544 RepID=A0A5J5F0Q3_9PEZI|nr:kinetochore complex Sim4 subunit Fta1-domain-containing protein [Sphaerosporella brunnea]
MSQPRRRREEQHPLFNTTYTLHTLGPLFSFPALTPAALAPHSKRLLQHLRGDVVRGVTIPTSEQAQLSRAGKLLQCTWSALPRIPAAGEEEEQQEEEEAEAEVTGVRIELVHENASYTALLLGLTPSEQKVKKEFTSLPLLLTRMPSPLREPLLKYLATTFDVLLRPLPLPDLLLRECLDAYIAKSAGGGAKDVVLTFVPGGEGVEGLKRVTITVDGEDVARLHARVAEGESWLGLLGEQLESVSGLRLTEVDLVKVAAGGFVLATEGRGKFFEGGAKATRWVLGRVLKEAAGRGGG